MNVIYSKMMTMLMEVIHVVVTEHGINQLVKNSIAIMGIIIVKFKRNVYQIYALMILILEK